MHIGRGHRNLGAKPTNQIFGSSFFRNSAVIRIFEALDRLSSVSVSKIIDQKTNFWKQTKSHKRFIWTF